MGQLKELGDGRWGPHCTPVKQREDAEGNFTGSCNRCLDQTAECWDVWLVVQEHVVLDQDNKNSVPA